MPQTGARSTTGRRPGVQVIARAAQILGTLSQEPAGLSLAEIVARLDLAKSTIYRLLQALEEEGLVESYDNRYRIGPLLDRSGMSDSEEIRLRTRPFLERLAVQLHETVHLSILVGDDCMFIDQVRWDRELTAGVVIGELLPAHSCASGKALLAGTAAAHGGTLPTSMRLRGSTRNTIVDRDALRAEITKIAKSKLAYDHEEIHAGISGIATFAETREGTCVGLGVPVPSVRFDDRERELRQALLAARPEFQQLVSWDRGPRAAQRPSSAPARRVSRARGFG